MARFLAEDKPPKKPSEKKQKDKPAASADRSSKNTQAVQKRDGDEQ